MFLSVRVGAEHGLGDRHGGHGPGPPGGERQVGERFDQLVLGEPVLAGEVDGWAGVGM